MTDIKVSFASNSFTIEVSSLVSLVNYCLSVCGLSDICGLDVSLPQGHLATRLLNLDLAASFVLDCAIQSVWTDKNPRYVYRPGSNFFAMYHTLSRDNHTL